MIGCSPSVNLYLRLRLSLVGAIAIILISFSSTDIALGATQAWGLWHQVRRGDTIWDIANKYRVSVRSILRSNHIPSARRLYVGKKLFIPGVVPSQRTDGTWYRVKRGDTLWAIGRKHNVSVKSLMHANKLKSVNRLQVNKRLFIPNPYATGFIAPMRISLTITSDYGYRRHPISRKLKFHHGIDFRAKPRTRVYASKGGRVVRAGWYGGYGNVVVIKHAGEYTTWYGHLSVIRVKAGQRVKRGQVIGLTGRSGHATGPHLHFEIRCKDKSVAASRYIRLP